MQRVAESLQLCLLDGRVKSAGFSWYTFSSESLLFDFLSGCKVYGVSDHYGYSIGGRVVGGGRKLGQFR